MSANTGTIFTERTRPPDRKLPQLLREPLLHFLLLGGLIFGITQAYESSTRNHEIVIDDELQNQLAQTFTQQFGNPPGDADMRHLLDQHLREEIMVREALALGLDRDDEIIRRRLVQKYEFLRQDLAAIGEPTEQQLRSYYAQHRKQYAFPARATFTHIYFSPDAGEHAAEARAERALDALKTKPKTERAPELGDSFPDLYDYASLGLREIEHLFGPSQLASAVLQAPVGRWSGPYRSGFGWHLLYVSAREPERTPRLEEVRDRVRSDYRQDARARENEVAFATLASKYTVRRVTTP